MFSSYKSFLSISLVWITITNATFAQEEKSEPPQALRLLSPGEIHSTLKLEDSGKSAGNTRSLIIELDDDRDPLKGKNLIRVTPRIPSLPPEEEKKLRGAKWLSLQIPEFKEALKSEVPVVRAYAANTLAMIRIKMGDSEQNVKLYPVLVELIESESDVEIAIGLHYIREIIEKSPKSSLRPLVKPLTQIIEHESLGRNTVQLLGGIGPIAKEALPEIREFLNKVQNRKVPDSGMNYIEEIRQAKDLRLAKEAIKKIEASHE